METWASTARRGREILVFSEDVVTAERVATVLGRAQFVVHADVRVPALRARLRAVNPKAVCLAIIDARGRGSTEVHDEVRRLEIPRLWLGAIGDTAATYLPFPLTDELVLYEVGRLTGHDLRG